MNIYKTILLNKQQQRKMLAVLIDPGKCHGSVLACTVAVLKSHTPDFLFVGGSHAPGASLNSLIELLKEEVKTRVVLFPGNVSQFSAKADGLLYLSLLSGRNPEYLIGQHITSAISIKESKIEVIPTGYLLIDGGKYSAVEYISNTRPIPSDKNEIALSTAVAGELLGMRLIYLEAGSGAKEPVTTSMIETLSGCLTIPLIVGGGIKTSAQMTDAFDAGADLVVIGNILETDFTLLSGFTQAVDEYNKR